MQPGCQAPPDEPVPRARQRSRPAGRGRITASEALPVCVRVAASQERRSVRWRRGHSASKVGLRREHGRWLRCRRGRPRDATSRSLERTGWRGDPRAGRRMAHVRYTAAPVSCRSAIQRERRGAVRAPRAAAAQHRRCWSLARRDAIRHVRLVRRRLVRCLVAMRSALGVPSLSQLRATLRPTRSALSGRIVGMPPLRCGPASEHQLAAGRGWLGRARACCCVIESRHSPCSVALRQVAARR